MENEKKYLSLRINTQNDKMIKSKNGKMFRSFESQQKHNLRIEEMDNFYLLSPEKTKDNFHYDMKKSENGIVDWEDLEDDFKKIKDDYQNNNPKNRHKRKLPTNTKLILNGLITFSTTMKDDYKNLSKEKLHQHIYNFIKKKYGKIISFDIHLDETTPHYHFQTFNYCFKNHKTHSRLLEEDLKNTKNRKNESQDELEKYLKENVKGFDYERGIEKGIKKDLELREKYKKQLEDLQKENDELRIKKNILENIFLSLDENYHNKLEKIIFDLEELKDEKETKLFLQKMTRVVKNSQVVRIEKLLNKYTNSLSKNRNKSNTNKR
jgi:hypothetical protein